MQTVPESAAAGTSSRLAAVPIENRQRSRSPAASAAGVASSTSSSESPKATRVPAERSDANARTSSKPRSARSSSVTVPTAPVAPTTPSLDMPSFGARVGQLEGLVERADRALDVLARNVERDLDRRRRHELGLDAELSQRPKGACCDAGVALHPSANDADLAEAFALRPAGAEPLEGTRSLLTVFPRSGEDDPAVDLDHGVDVDRGVSERLEELGRVGALDLVHRLLEHPFVLLANPGAVHVCEGRAYVELDIVVARELDGA